MIKCIACKKGMVAFLIAVILISYVPIKFTAEAAGINLFPKGNFEQGLPEHRAASVNVSLSNDYYRSGCGSVRVEQQSSWSGIYFPVGLTNGRSYTCSVWFKYDALSTGNANIILATKTNENGVVHFTERNIAKSGEWTLLEGEFTVQEPVLSKFELLIYSGSKNTFYLDDLVIKDYPNPYENQYSDADFENPSDATYTKVGVSAIYETVHDYVYEGTSALRVTQETQAGSIDKRVYIKPNKKYFVSVQGMVFPDEGKSSSLSVGMKLNNIKTVFLTGPVMTPENGYVKTSGIYTAPPTGLVLPTLSISANLPNGEPITYILDSIEFYEINDFKLSSSFPKHGGIFAGGKTISLKFSNNFDKTLILNTQNYALNGSSTNIENIEITSDNSCFVHLKSELAQGTEYNLTINDVTDIFGQTISEGVISFTTPAEPLTKIQSADYRIYIDYGKNGQKDITDFMLTAGEATGVIDYIYNGSEQKDVLACMALYNNNKLIKIVSQKISLKTGGLLTDVALNKIDVPNTLGGLYTLKAFLWDYTSINPLLMVKTLKDHTVTELIVNPDGTGDFTSPMLANASIKDSGPKKLYKIIVHPGVYTDVEWTVKPYTTIIGTDRERCWIKGELPPSATNYQIDNTSTIWLIETAGIENLKITSKNMRYPVHSEAEGRNKNAVHKIVNCHIENYGALDAVQFRLNNPNYHANPADNDPSKVWGGISGDGSAAWGYGSGSGITEIFENSTFISKNQGWYVHNNKDFEKPQINILNNTHISGGYTHKRIMQVESLGSGTKDEVIFNNCTFDGLYVTQDDYPWISQKPENQYANHADYTLTFNNCDPIGYQDAHRGLALAIFSKSTADGSSVSVGGSAAPVVFGEATSRNGGGGLRGYIYGHWDISGILVSLYQNVEVANTLGRRLGDCTVQNKTLDITFDSSVTKSVVFDENYTNASNDAILSKINAVISDVGTAAAYNVTSNEYYPKMTDKELNLVNSTQTGIPRFSAVCYDSSKNTVRLMTQSDDISKFLGISLEPIAPGQSGRILTEGLLSHVQLNGYNGSVDQNTNLAVSANGTFEPNGSGAKVFEFKFQNWVYFKGRR